MIVSLFDSVEKAWVSNEIDLTWPEAVELFQTPIPAERKEDVGMYNLGRFKSLNDPTTESARRYHYKNGQRQPTYDLIPNTVRRCKTNLLGISGLVLDIDDNFEILEAIDKYKNYEFVLYTTFNNLRTQDPDTGQLKQKYRVVIPFIKELAAADIMGRIDSMKTIFPEVDNSCFSMSQSFYFHSGQYLYTYHNQARIIDPYQEFVYIPRPPPPTITYHNPIGLEKLTVHLNELKKIYNELPYSVRARVTWAVMSEASRDDAIMLMRARWPDANLNGKYETFAAGYCAGRMNFGFIINMIKKINPLYKGGGNNDWKIIRQELYNKYVKN